jgi:hypothetical protein
MHGVQVADGPYSISKDCVVHNYLGTLEVTESASLKTLGAQMGVNFIKDGTDVLVQVTPTTPNSSQVQATLEIVGPWTTYQVG